MPLYLTRFSYTPATWAKLIKNPEDRRLAAKQYIEAVGGKMHGFWYAFGDHDGYNLWEAPDNVSMAATAIAISAGGALSSLQTTVLLTVEETLTAMQKGLVDRVSATGRQRIGALLARIDNGPPCKCQSNSRSVKLLHCPVAPEQ